MEGHGVSLAEGGKDGGWERFTMEEKYVEG